MTESLAQYYRCPEGCIQYALKGALSEARGYFRFGDAICYGRYSGAAPSCAVDNGLHDASHDTVTKNGTTYLPFDPAEVLENLRCELYTTASRGIRVESAFARIYYLLRPIIPFTVRSYLKQLYLNDWEKLAFPRWPVDCSVDSLLEQLLLLSVKANAARRIPFIWFWPEGASSCAIMTHDVETKVGQQFLPTLMDIDDAFAIKASFQIVPESRYNVSPQFLDSLHERGFEIVVHDLNHDGHLYRSREEFLQRAEKINFYGKQYGAEGFRAAVLYRNQLWYDALKFSFDMSVPNVGHLDPQHGGCCTVMPYFIGDILELPVTTVQDYMLFYILNDYSSTIWERQIDLIMQKHGLISFIVHPDYVMKPRERGVYETLLAHLDRIRREKGVWITTPSEVNRWWRQRAKMKLVENGDRLQIEGAGSERARIAYATERDGQLVMTLSASGQSVSSLEMNARR
ncbi:MAG: hypothetical protein WCA49_03720 [Candidatus Sulfotelmatobacter sp.]